MEINRLRRNAIIYDCVCIVIAMVVLYLANRQLLPMWALIVGALLAAAFMLASLWCLLRARKLLRQTLPTTAPQAEEVSDQTNDSPTND